MAKTVFGANWKMNPASEEEAVLLAESYVNQGIRGTEDKEVVIFAPTMFLSALSKLESLEHAKIKLGAQRISRYEQGAFTGDSSPLWLNKYGISDVLVGHSEVRQHYQGNIDDMLRAEVINAFNHGLRVTYCVGETREQREQGDTIQELEEQIFNVIDGIPLEGKNIIIAYEPVWAIGADPPVTPTMQEIEHTHSEISRLMSHAGHPKEKPLLIQYGGSMNPANVVDIMNNRHISGGLVGGASLDAAAFAKVVNYD